MPGSRRPWSRSAATTRRRFAATFDTSLVGTLAQLVMVEGGHGYLEIPQASIRSVEVQRSLLKKRVLVTVDDGGCHTFDYGALSVEKIAAAIGPR